MLRQLFPGLLVLTLGLPALAQQEGSAATDVVATHGDWQVRCDEGREVCVMSQIGKDGSGKDLVEVQLRRLEGQKAPDGTAIPAAIQIVAPLGVLLPAGLRIQVDGKEERAAPYEVCTQGGCLVRQPMSDGLLNEMKAGNAAKLTLVAVPQREIATNISLNGFTKAFESLK